MVLKGYHNLLPNVDIIFCNNAIGHIMNEFDLPCVSNYFDGLQFVVGHPQLHKGELQVPRKWNEDRIFKYCKRGYHSRDENRFCCNL